MYIIYSMSQQVTVRIEKLWADSSKIVCCPLNNEKRLSNCNKFIGLHYKSVELLAVRELFLIV